ncbi:MAG: DNA primase catalytic subunit PriS [Candidatus Thermoplasmatota archaeon]|nr:DNA primase catalytic subunit PriS [Candidatus Thermoplasmatota archaeon]
MPAVDKLQSREIGFIPFFGTMTRHRSFNDVRELSHFVSNVVPRHIYYSSAYYEYPEERVMKDKKWLGAELIFDLDADHIPGASKMTYEQILKEVKKHTHRLIFEFLLGDIGLEEKDLKVFFSGGRGYHVHVVSDWIYSLSSDARREIANYVRGEGLSPADLRRAMLETPSKMSGWKKRIDDQVVNFYTLLNKSDQYAEILSKVFGTEKKISSYVENLNKIITGKSVKKIEVFRTEGIEKYQYMDVNDQLVFSKIMDSVISDQQCEIDEPVTTDIHRLIRMPQSLHGKSGLIVKPIHLDKFESFDPLIDARVPEFSNQELTVNLPRDFSMSFGGITYKLSEGINKLPGDFSIFLVATKIANFV